MTEIKNKIVLVTGGAGFLGQHLVSELEKCHPKKIIVPRKATQNLLNPKVLSQIFETERPELVIHLAGVVGGIKANRDRSGQFFYENALMGIQLIEQARTGGVEKILVAGTICAYPKLTPTPFNEKNLWEGYPEETNAPYGLAKRMLLVQLQAYRQQYGFNGIFIMPTNLYGPGDNFDPDTSHVIPALIKKMIEAKEQKLNSVTLWGSGKPTREFLYVEEAARGLVLALKHYDGVEPVNLGSEIEISISDLAQLIAKKVGYTGKIFWDPQMPDGQPRRLLDTTLSKKAFQFQNQVSFEEGLSKTMEWYNKKTH